MKNGNEQSDAVVTNRAEPVMDLGAEIGIGEPVLVTTERRGVFFGRLADRKGNWIALRDAKCAIRWNTKKGFLELADEGPNEGSKIGSAAPLLELFGVTSLARLTKSAAEKWAAA